MIEINLLAPKLTIDQLFALIRRWAPAEYFPIIEVLGGHRPIYQKAAWIGHRRDYAQIRDRETDGSQRESSPPRYVYPGFRIYWEEHQDPSSWGPRRGAPPADAVDPEDDSIPF